MTTVETTELRPGHPISRVIRGGWQLAGDHGAVDREEAIRDMEAFVDAGIFTFDCADIYTGVEEMIGQFIADLRARRGASVADRVTVHTKLVPDLTLLPEIGTHGIEAIVDRSLNRLQIERLHLVQFFWWDLAQGDPVGALEALKDCQKKGKIATLGTTNWDEDGMQRFVDAGFDIASAQVQYSVLDRRPANGLVDWAGAHDIQILAYGTLAGGFLTERWLGVDDPGFAFENRSLVKYRLIIDEFGPWERFQRLLRALKAVGDRHGVSLSAVATRWVLDQPGVAAGIVGARYARHLPQTLETFSFALNAQDRAEIGAVIAEADGPAGRVYSLERDRNSRHGRIMKYNLNTRPDDAVHGAKDG
ncbi:aldo/keto reductase [Cognatishimia sp. F0-27]|uniref:aldo/keto reductase n=1 Tax=Cognatishimia sp. F0-27 TaxID=2816855 RepID=UPI001D0CC981|nr:aldo/keto reductase [Cognatishimia sp. F0-27]MCC1495038.1 aldo/keto reductase [Cognatishimia sp. F0-27]